MSTTRNAQLASVVHHVDGMSNVYVLKVLKFNGWYKETVPETPSEQYRIHYVDILYFLEDDSMTIIEPKVENSGLPQGNEKLCFVSDIIIYFIIIIIIFYLNFLNVFIPSVLKIPRVKSYQNLKQNSWMAKGSGRRQSQTTHAAKLH